MKQVVQWNNAKLRVREAERAVMGKGQGKRRRYAATAHGAQARAQQNLEEAQAHQASVAVGLQMDEIDFLFSMSAMVSLNWALERDAPNEIPGWWAMDSCIVCGDRVASICRELSSVMHKHIGG